MTGGPLIPEPFDPRRMVPGDWAVIQHAADLVSAFPPKVQAALESLDAVQAPGLWEGSAGEGYTRDVTTLRSVLTRYRDAYPAVAEALYGFADALRVAQGECADVVIPKMQDAGRLSSTARNEARNSGEDDTPQDDPGEPLRLEAEQEYARVVQRVNTAAAGLARDLGVQLATLSAAPPAPTSTPAVADTPTAPDAATAAHVTELLGVAPLLGPATAVPTHVALTHHTWDTFSLMPGHTLGSCVPGALPPAHQPLTAAQLAETRTAELRAAPASRPLDALPLAGEPVDVATGEMTLLQTDVELPGVLPLVISRHHRTQFSRGHWFGTRWASTLDQHLLLTAEGVVLTTGDGVVLRYPVPVPGNSVMPDGGARWPLFWDGRPGGSFTVTDPQRGWTWTFEPLERPSAVVPLRFLRDRNGNVVEHVYGPDGTPVEVRHSGGYRVAVDSAFGRVTALRLLTDAAGPDVPLASFRHSADGNLTEVVNSSDLPLRFTYDDQHRITSWTDRTGTWYRYTYDTYGRCVHGTGTGGALENTFAYDTASRVTRMTDALGGVREFVLDAGGRVVRASDPLGNTTATTWDAFNRITSVTDPLGHTTRYAYDHTGNLHGVVHPDGGITVTDWDPALCRPVRVTAPDGSRHHYTYDHRGNVLTSTDPLGTRTACTYDARGNLATVTDALSHTTRVQCDAAGLPVHVTDPLGRTSAVRRDALGRATSVTDPLGRTTHTRFTTEGLPTRRELPDGTTESWTWDAEGNLLTHTNPAGFTTTHEPSAFDLPASRTDPDDACYTFAYDRLLRLTAVTNPQGHTWHYRYDTAGRLTSETDFNGRTLTYRHDAAGRLVARTNGAGEGVVYTRDVHGNPLTQTHTATGRRTEFGYDPLGRLVRAANPDVDLRLARDHAGRVVRESSNGLTLTNSYDPLGRRIARRTPGGLTSTWTYDAAGRPTSLTHGGDTPVLTFRHDAAGRETARHFGPTVTFATEYDPGDRLAAQTTRIGERPNRLAAALSPGLAPTVSHRREYTWRPDSHLTAVTDTTAGHTAYDLAPSGRVIAVRAHDWTERYAYDPAGNLTHATWPTPEDDPDAAQGARHVTGTLTHRAGRTHYTYDTQGRLVARRLRTDTGNGSGNSSGNSSGATPTWIFHWDADDRLTDAVTPDRVHWHYTYDALARRIAKTRTDTGEQVTFTWDGSHLAQQHAADGSTLTWDYDPGTWRLAAQTHHTADGRPATRAAVTDAAGTPVSLIDPGGTRHTQPTTLWGAPAAPPPPDGTPLRFPGQYADAETGFHYNYFRYYDPVAAQYATPDPLGLAPAPNHHAYPPNPLVQLDPTGLMPGCTPAGPSTPAPTAPPGLPVPAPTAPAAPAVRSPGVWAPAPPSPQVLDQHGHVAVGDVLR